MLKAKILRVLRAVATGATGLVLLGSTAAYAHGFGGPSWFFGGNDEASLDSNNDADVDVENKIEQDARSGDAEVKADDDRGCHFWWCDDNDESAVLGDATTGDASNSASQSTSVAVTQGGACDCLEGLEGDFDEVNVDSDNDADVDIENRIEQDADSGDAEVRGGEGNATTGAASNNASQSTTVVINQ